MTGPLAVLFDIDETLVHTGGAGKRSWAWAFDQLHGVPADIGKHTSAGETDPQVGRETFRAVLGRDPSHEEMMRLYSAYLWHLSEEIWSSETYRVLDGAEATLRRSTSGRHPGRGVRRHGRRGATQNGTGQAGPLFRLRRLRIGLP